MLADAAAAAVVGWVWFFFSLVPKLQLAFIALRVHFNFPIFWLIAQKWLSSWLAGWLASFGINAIFTIHLPRN